MDVINQASMPHLTTLRDTATWAFPVRTPAPDAGEAAVTTAIAIRATSP